MKPIRYSDRLFFCHFFLQKQIRIIPIKLFWAHVFSPHKALFAKATVCSAVVPSFLRQLLASPTCAGIAVIFWFNCKLKLHLELLVLWNLFPQIKTCGYLLSNATFTMNARVSDWGKHRVQPKARPFIIFTIQKINVFKIKKGHAQNKFIWITIKLQTNWCFGLKI